MALMNELMVGRYNRFVQKLFSMKGNAALNQVSSELQLSIQFMNGIENRYLEGWDTFSIAVGIAAQVGLTAGLRLRNPASSNVIAVLEYAGVQSTLLTVTDAWSMSKSAQAADLNLALSATTLCGLDPRSRPQSTCVVSSGTNGSAAPFQAKTSTNLAVSSTLNNALEWPLLPGQAIDVVNATLNQGITIVYRWRERFLEDSERA